MFLWFLLSVFNILILSRLFFSGFHSVVNGFLRVSEMFSGFHKVKTIFITILGCHCFFVLDVVMLEKELLKEKGMNCDCVTKS